jgi:hypothetical protein
MLNWIRVRRWSTGRGNQVAVKGLVGIHLLRMVGRMGWHVGFWSL